LFYKNIYSILQKLLVSTLPHFETVCNQHIHLVGHENSHNKWAHYFHDQLKEVQMFSKRQMGKGSMMGWAGFGFNRNGGCVWKNEKY
jgi:hypothetical protein